MIEFVIMGEARGKGRPRFRNIGRYVTTYTDKETISYENLVKISYINSNSERYMNKEILRCEIEIYQGIPKSVSKKKREQMIKGEIRPGKKPDIDNCIKAILDGLNKVAYSDDTQIVEIESKKWYDEIPRVEVRIKEI